MPIEILMPALSPTMKEGNLAKWLKKEGDEVVAGDVIAEIETDKATMEVEAVDEGVLAKILISEGAANVAVNQPIALLLEEGEDEKSLNDYKITEVKAANESKPAAEKTQDAAPKQSDNIAPQVQATRNNVTNIPASNNANVTRIRDQKTVTTVVSDNINNNVAASPVAKRIAAQNNLDLGKINGTGPKGRVVKEDITNFLTNNINNDVITRSAEEYKVIPNSNVRNVIANRLLEAKQTIPHFYLTVDCNLEQLLNVRVQINNAAPQDESGKPLYKVSVNDLVIKAAALALQQKPKANASWDGDAILEYNNIDISVAVSIDEGLITPIIRNAEQKSIIAISNEMKYLAARARKGELQPEEFQGGGFSISNLGMYGIKQFNAIVNPPQSAILAVGSGEKRVVVDAAGNFVAVDMMSVSLSCDHRVVDGALGAELLNAFKFYIENPAVLLL